MRRLLFCLLILLVITLPTIHAQRPDAPPYAERGTFPVGTREFVLEDAERPLDGTIWYPALNPEELEPEVRYTAGLAAVDGHALRDAEPDLSAGPYPLVVFSHGLGGFRFQSVYFVEHLASHGFVVIATEHPGSTIMDAVQDKLTDETIAFNFGVRPLDVLRQIAYAETLTADDGEMAGLIDIENIAVTGHSFGGYTSLAAGGGRINPEYIMEFCDDVELGELERACDMTLLEVAAQARGFESVPEGLWEPTTDPRIKALVLLAPGGGVLFGEAGAAAVTIPTLVIVGSDDHTTPAEENANLIYGAIASPFKALMTLNHADHYIYVEQCTPQMISFGFFDSCSDDVWDMARAHDLITHTSTAFFLATLKNDAEAINALQPEMVDFIGVEYEAVLP